MGQRHQLFIVAQVSEASGRAKEYRCVAAFHHQWCYGKLPLRCVNRFKHLARVKDNAALIQRDLDRYPEGLQRKRSMPCPYISFLAGAAFTTDISKDYDEPYFSGICYEPASMGSMDGDNNDGITIIDVSTPGSPSYCFVSFCGLEAIDGEDPERCVPLTAEQYLRSYYPEVDDPLASDEEHKAEVYNTKAIRDLDDMPVLTLDVLAATWPHEYRAIKRLRATPDQPELPELEYGSGSSGNALTYGTSLVDLSKQDLVLADLLQVLKDRAPFRRLDISHNETIDKAALAQILKEHRLEWLNIDGCSVSKDDLADLLKHSASLFRGVEAVIHPAFLSLENFNFKDEGMDGIPSAFRFLYSAGGRWQGRTGWVSLPFFGVDQLVQNLTDIIEVCEHRRYSERPYLHNLPDILGSCYRAEGQPWGKRTLQEIPPQSSRLDTSQLSEGYTFVLSARHRDDRLEDFQYGIVLPGGSKECVDIKCFLQHLEDEGWPKPKDGEGVKRLAAKFNEETGPGLLENLGDVLEAKT